MFGLLRCTGISARPRTSKPCWTSSPARRTENQCPRGNRRTRMPRTALFPGSFDPVTNGHLDLVRQASRLAEKLVVAIGTHPGKAPLFSVDERLSMLEETCAPVARAAGCELACTTFADLVVTAA